MKPIVVQTDALGSTTIKHVQVDVKICLELPLLGHLNPYRMMERTVKFYAWKNLPVKFLLSG